MTNQPARQLFVCVYRRHIPSPSQWHRTLEASATDPRLLRFLDEYWREDRYFDWGDDPGFFSARELFGDARRASWAVCRPDVRDDIQLGDAVAFFVGKPAFIEERGRRRPSGPVDYFYVGCGTVGRLVDRRDIWLDEGLAMYRGFYNVLARPGSAGDLLNVEVFHPHHSDWERRAAAPLVLFATERSLFDLERPHHVAHYDPTLGVPETWNADPTSRRLEGLLFGDGRPRRLRTSKTGYQHAKRVLRNSDQKFDEIRDELLQIAVARRL